jgi:hypothetical protein
MQPAPDALNYDRLGRSGSPNASAELLGAGPHFGAIMAPALSHCPRRVVPATT